MNHHHATGQLLLPSLTLFLAQQAVHVLFTLQLRHQTTLHKHPNETQIAEKKTKQRSSELNNVWVIPRTQFSTLQTRKLFTGTFSTTDESDTVQSAVSIMQLVSSKKTQLHGIWWQIIDWHASARKEHVVSLWPHDLKLWTDRIYGSGLR